MKILDKLKNALFEEEYVEIEEKPVKKPIKKEKKVDKIKEISKEIEEKPIAKKIVLPEREKKEEVKITTSDDFVEEEVKEVKKEKTFPIISDNEFLTDPVVEETHEEPIVEKKKNIFEKYEEPKMENTYQQKKQEQHPKLYGMDEIPIPEPEYGTYEKDDRTYFKPSPIISPIYGILDKNYRKEEIIPKREVRLTSAYSRENLDVDAVRKKAYGTLSNDVETITDEVEESNFTDQDLVDLSSVNETPEVKKVTIADAEEYFNDLGLEYNVDYKDGQKEKATGRRYTETEEDFAPVVDKEEFEARQNTDSIVEDDSIGDDDNLFDLIDSMYEKE